MSRTTSSHPTCTIDDHIDIDRRALDRSFVAAAAARGVINAQ